MSELRSIKDLIEKEWITEGTLKLESPNSRDGTYVEHCIPAIFPSYCKIFHNIYEDASIEDHTITWDDVHKQQSFDLDDPVQKLLSSATTTYGGTDALGTGNLMRIR